MRSGKCVFSVSFPLPCLVLHTESLQGGRVRTSRAEERKQPGSPEARASGPQRETRLSLLPLTKPALLGCSLLLVSSGHHNAMHNLQKPEMFLFQVIKLLLEPLERDSCLMNFREGSVGLNFFWIQGPNSNENQQNVMQLVGWSLFPLSGIYCPVNARTICVCCKWDFRLVF